MPRKRRSRHVGFSVHTVEMPEHPDPQEVTDHDLVRATLRDFDELTQLPGEVRERLVEDLVFAIRLWLAGVDVGKHGLSNKKEAQNIFVENVGRAWELATGLRATRWRYRYKGDGPDVDAPESPLFRLARELGDAFGRPLPKDLKLAGQRASKIRYGAMSPALKVEQDALLLAAGRQRPGELSVRLKAYVAQGGARAVPKPETVWGALPLELRLLALGLSSANNFDGSSALAGALFDR